MERFREAFGDAVPLPIAFGYSDTPASEIGSVPKCMIGRISKVRDGESLALCAENVICGGDGFYTAFKEILDPIDDSALFQKAFSIVKRRINK